MIKMGPLRPEDRAAWGNPNAQARVLYDKVARFTGFIRYGYPLLRSGRAALLPLGGGPDPGDEHLDA